MKETETIECLRDSVFKDANPIDTVNRIQAILNKYNIETEMCWVETDVPYCCSLRVTVNGTTFGTNGKGLTKEFALASGYGELMERLQLGYIGKLEMQKDGNFSIEDGISEKVPAKVLFERNREWYELYASRLKFFTGENVEAEKILMQYADDDGNLRAIPFYCANKKSKEYIPTKLLKTVYSANGCAAGNTMEETIVQCLSEIVERHYLIELMFNDMTPPNVPEEVLKKCEVAYSIISYLREKNFKVIVKDCSLGNKFPVLSVCIIDRNTGKYHTHFAANPVFEIALERALTESFQGRNIRRVSEFIDFRYKKDGYFDLNNLFRELTRGVSEKLPGFFVGETEYKYNEEMGFLGENNKDLLKECVEYFSNMGFDILIRDASCLGFDTYQVIIPGYSEVLAHRLSNKHDEYHYRNSAMKTLRNPSSANINEKLGCFMSLQRRNKGFVSETRLHANLTAKEESYFMAASLGYVYYDLKKYKETLKCINTMIAAQITKNEEFLICIKRYISLLTSKFDIEKIREILYFFHKEESVNKLFSCVENNKNPLDEFTLHCDLKCNESCVLYDRCCNKKVAEISDIILQKRKELNFDKFVQKAEAIFTV